MCIEFEQTSLLHLNTYHIEYNDTISFKDTIIFLYDMCIEFEQTSLLHLNIIIGSLIIIVIGIITVICLLMYLFLSLILIIKIIIFFI